MKEKQMKNNKGITLVALVVTIIILIILAGISINMLVGTDGLITKAKQAKENIELAQTEEQTRLNELYSQLNSELAGSSFSDQPMGMATADKILKNYTAYVNGQLVIGTMENRGELNWNPSESTSLTIEPGYYSGGTISTENAYNAGLAGSEDLYETDYELVYNAFGSPDSMKTHTVTVEKDKIYIINCASARYNTDNLVSTGCSVIFKSNKLNHKTGSSDNDYYYINTMYVVKATENTLTLSINPGYGSLSGFQILRLPNGIANAIDKGEINCELIYNAFGSPDSMKTHAVTVEKGGIYLINSASSKISADPDNLVIAGCSEIFKGTKLSKINGDYCYQNTIYVVKARETTLKLTCVPGYGSTSGFQILRIY